MQPIRFISSFCLIPVKYLSTRGDRTEPATERQFSEILLEGLAPDGGLYLPAHYPKIDDATLARWRGLAYPDLAFEILSLYIDDMPSADLKALAHKTYTAATYGTETIVPVRQLEPAPNPLYIQALSNGPTLAFKDMAMQLLGNLFEYELARRCGKTRRARRSRWWRLPAGLSAGPSCVPHGRRRHCRSCPTGRQSSPSRHCLS